MARYKIYDNSSDVITPVGEVLTAEQWLDRYPWGRFAKMIVGGGVINGTLAALFGEAGPSVNGLPRGRLCRQRLPHRRGLPRRHGGL